MYNLTKLNNEVTLNNQQLNQVITGYVVAELSNSYSFEYETEYVTMLGEVMFNVLNKQNDNMVAEYLYNTIYEYEVSSELLENLSISVGNCLNMVNLNTNNNVNLLINFIEQHYNVPNSERVFK